MTTTDVASLRARSLRSGARMVLTLAAVLFVSAGTLAYWQAWAYVAFHSLFMGATTAYLLRTDPELVRRRLALEDKGETETVHKVLFALLALLAPAMCAVSGLDRRFGWSAVSLPVMVAAWLAVAAGSFGIFWVLRENTFASSVIELAEQQRVISSGPYRLVRHPMYTSMLLMFGATPLALGSYRAMFLFLPLCGVFIVRLLAEERFLCTGLPGYASYMRETRKRLVPGLW